MLGFKRKKPLTPKLAKIIKIVKRMSENGVIRFSGNTITMPEAVGYRPSNPESFYVNLYLFMIISGNIKKGEEVFFKEEETDLLRYTYSPEKGLTPFA